MTYKFQYTRTPQSFDRSLPTTITHEINCQDCSLTELLDSFKDFLTGCGFVIDGYLEVVSMEETNRIPEIHIPLDSTYPDGVGYWANSDFRMSGFNKEDTI